MIERILVEAKASLEFYKNAGGEKPATADAMFEALAVTLRPSDYDDEVRLGSFFKLLMKCTTNWEKKEDVRAFAASVIAADYYLSVEGRVSIPFLNKALEVYARLLRMEPFVIDDAESFVGIFRSGNLKGKWWREFKAVKNIYILSGAAKKLELDMPFDELPADHTPACWSVMDVPLFILLGLTGGLLIIYALDDYRTARFAGTPIPFSEAMQGGEVLAIILGVVLIIAEFAIMMKQYNPNYNRFMSRYCFWKYSLKH